MAQVVDQANVDVINRCQRGLFNAALGKVIARCSELTGLKSLLSEAEVVWARH